MLLTVLFSTAGNSIGSAYATARTSAGFAAAAAGSGTGLFLGTAAEFGPGEGVLVHLVRAVGEP